MGGGITWFEIAVLVILVIFFMGYGARRASDMVVVRSTVDGESYAVQNRPDRQEAADLLARLCRSMARLVRHVREKYPANKDIRRLARNFNPRTVSEAGRGETYTSYTVNKGERMVFCLRERKNGTNRLHDLNLLMYVAVHELAHLMTKQVGHTSTFWANNRLLLQDAIDMKLYRRVDFSASPVNYCGVQIATSVL